MRTFSVQGGGPKPGCQELRCEQEVRKDRPASDSLFHSWSRGQEGEMVALARRLRCKEVLVGLSETH